MKLSDQEQAALLELAHTAIHYGVAHGHALSVDVANYSPNLASEQATFVTLKLDGDLRGCIGKIHATQPLVCDVVENAYSAAFRDSRFPGVTQQEADALKLSISLLTAPVELEFDDRNDLLVKLQRDKDGVIISDAGLVGVFLPVMWSRFTEAGEFISVLKSKAGMSPKSWSDTLCVSTFKVECIKDAGVED